MVEENICPVCLAFQNPNTGECLVCGKKYHTINIPTDISLCQNDNNPIDFIVHFNNGFMTFSSYPRMEINRSQDEVILNGIPQFFFLDNYKNEAKIVFDFIPDEKTKTLFTVYTEGKIQ